ncbi:MAG: radical SAM protein [Archangiaceae bacterium]|nr:radical SAM protein [Archangiaceae bacterium]
MSRTLEPVVAELLRPLLEAAPRPDAWKLVEWDCEQGICVSLERRGAVLLVELEPRDDARPCSARTARFNVCARYRFSNEPLDAAARSAVSALTALVAAREVALSGLERPPPEARAEVREVRVDRVLMREGRGQYYLNAYAGCMIGCPYCYVAKRGDLSRALQGLAPRPWGRWVDVKVNAAEVLAREVQALPPGQVRMSPILTDPYQPLERRYRVTRACLEVLLKAGFEPMLLTRSRLIEDDVELLARFPTALVGISIPTDDDAVRARFEPGADAIDERLAALERCSKAGVFTFAVVQPTLPMNPARLVERLSPWVKAVRIDRMHELEQARPLYEAAGCV